ncbi:MAG: hypothetical protein BWY45_01231 [Euryarchaeota archaeon ADurb.Bin294]|nr:MAG: hypothetical protein BWY45_01231 [Euryarchaeota archaeon ADurb.Bin294]
MASSLITGAVSLLLIIIAGYVIATGILMVAETTVMTQIDVTAANEQLLQSSIQITSSEYEDPELTLIIKNTGNFVYGNNSFDKMDLYIFTSTGMKKYGNDNFSYVFLNDTINKKMWDPSENISVNISGIGAPLWVKFVTSNGAFSSLNIE